MNKYKTYQIYINTDILYILQYITIIMIDILSLLFTFIILYILISKTKDFIIEIKALLKEILKNNCTTILFVIFIFFIMYCLMYIKFFLLHYNELY